MPRIEASHNFRRTIAGLTAAAAVGASLATAGCAPDDEPDIRIERIVDGDSSPTDELAKRIAATQTVLDVLVGSEGGDKASDLLGAEKGHVIGGPTLQAAASKQRAADIIRTFTNESDDEQPDPDKMNAAFGAIGDPKLAKRATTAVMTTYVGKLLDRVGNNDIEPAAVRTYLQGSKWNNTNTAKVMKVAETLDAADAADLGAYFDAKDVAAAKRDLADISDKKLRELAMANVEAQLIDDDFDRLGYRGISLKQVKRHIKGLSDPTVRAMARRAMRTYNPDDAYWEIGREPYNVSELKYRTADKLDARQYVADDAARDMRTATTNLTDSLRVRYGDLSGEIEGLISTEVARHNHMPTVRNAEVHVDRIADGSAPIDLSDVRGRKQIRDSYKPDTTYDQFAEVYAEDGAMRFRVEDKSRLSPEAQKSIEAVIAANRPLLEAAFRRGDLLSMRFVIADEYNPFYAPNSREIVMVLPRDDSTSVDQLRSAMTHETVHSLVNSAFAEESSVTKAEAAKVKQACTLLSRDAYRGFQNYAAIFPDKLDALISKVPNSDKKLYRKLKSEIEKGNISKLLEDPLAMDSYFAKDLRFTDCQEVTLGDLMRYIADKSGSEDPSKTADSAIENAKDLPEFEAVLDMWIGSVVDFSLFKRLSESQFVDTEYMYKEYLGHPRDNANEMMATFTDVTLVYTSQVRKLLRTMSSQERKIVLQATDASYTIIEHRHPALKKHLDKVYKQLADTK